MASRPVPPCPHELRPGTTVCLRCQHAERGIKRARQRQMLARGGAAVLSLAVIAAVGIAAATVLRSRIGAGKGAARDQGARPAPDTMTAAADSIDSLATLPPPTREVGGPSILAKGNLTAPAAPGLAGTAGRAPIVAPVVPVGRTVLRDTMIVDRAGDTVRVSFDLLLSRTRRPDKFEAIVRSTLPQVYGAPADSALRALPVGALANAGDLITTLTERGFHIPLGGGRTIAVWPETRVGRDGPLVVAYRAVASR